MMIGFDIRHSIWFLEPVQELSLNIELERGGGGVEGGERGGK